MVGAALPAEIRRQADGELTETDDRLPFAALRAFDSDLSRHHVDQLSERELQIAIMIVNCQKVQEISDKLFLSPKTVNTYRYRIFEKLAINSDVELTLMAVRHGMVDVESMRNNG